MYLLYKGIVHPWLCDVMGHMNVRHYMGMFDDASLQLLVETTGWNTEATEWQGKGWADVHHKIEYKGELKVGALLEINGGIIKIGNSSLSIYYEMKNKLTGEIAATMSARTVFFDLKSRRSIPLSHEMRLQAEQGTL